MNPSIVVISGNRIALKCKVISDVKYVVNLFVGKMYTLLYKFSLGNRIVSAISCDIRHVFVSNSLNTS